MILYINNEKCSSVEQLKGYFQEGLTPDSDIYFDLLDYGRSGEIAVWLREMNEPELATRVESIPDNLGDSAFYAQLKAAVTGSEVTDSERFKPPFEQCLAFEGSKQDTNDNEVTISVLLKVLMCVNEDYELSASNNWGTRALMVNPYNYEEGKTARIDFTFRRRPGKEMGEITIKAEEKELACEKLQSFEEIVETSAIEDEEFTVGGVSFNMIRVEHGEFMMGATDEQEEPDDDEKPVHKVRLTDDYYMGETPVTQSLWRAVMNDNPSWFGEGGHGSYEDDWEELPVEWVSWDDCQRFIRKLNRMTGKRFRLPTEAEWEFAARGGNESCGYLYSGSDYLDDVAWYEGNSDQETHPVKELEPNELGIYDMSGNVLEWCQDWYGAYTSSSQTNPKGPTSGSRRVVRGGSWYYDARYCRLSRRGSYSPGDAFIFLGFRLALSE